MARSGHIKFMNEAEEKKFCFFSINFLLPKCWKSFSSSWRPQISFIIIIYWSIVDYKQHAKQKVEEGKKKMEVSQDIETGFNAI